MAPTAHRPQAALCPRCVRVCPATHKCTQVHTVVPRYAQVPWGCGAAQENVNQFPAEFVSCWAEGLQVGLVLVSWGLDHLWAT